MTLKMNGEGKNVLLVFTIKAWNREKPRTTLPVSGQKAGKWARNIRLMINDVRFLVYSGLCLSFIVCIRSDRRVVMNTEFLGRRNETVEPYSTLYFIIFLDGPRKTTDTGCVSQDSRTRGVLHAPRRYNNGLSCMSTGWSHHQFSLNACHNSTHFCYCFALNCTIYLL